MSINKDHLLAYVIAPTLKLLGLDSATDRNLLLGTCAKESNMGTYLHQINGPALGIFQIEPVTHNDIWTNFLPSRPELAARIKTLSPTRSDENLIYNLRYAAAICRIIYLRGKDPLPDANDINGLANYWKKYYNTSKGSGTVEEFIDNYNRYVL